MKLILVSLLYYLSRVSRYKYYSISYAEMISMAGKIQSLQYNVDQTTSSTEKYTAQKNLFGSFGSAQAGKSLVVNSEGNGFRFSSQEGVSIFYVADQGTVAQFDEIDAAVSGKKLVLLIDDPEIQDVQQGYWTLGDVEVSTGKKNLKFYSVHDNVCYTLEYIKDLNQNPPTASIQRGTIEISGVEYIKFDEPSSPTAMSDLKNAIDRAYEEGKIPIPYAFSGYQSYYQYVYYLPIENNLYNYYFSSLLSSGTFKTLIIKKSDSVTEIESSKVEIDREYVQTEDVELDSWVQHQDNSADSIEVSLKISSTDTKTTGFRLGTASDSLKWNGWNLIVGSVGSSEKTIYMVGA